MTMTITNVRHGALLGLALLLCMGSASAQMFKWVDANGKTHFTDTPQPSNAKPVAVQNTASAPQDTAGLPYALANAMRKAPVTLYTDSGCTGCDAGRSYLRGRGIPYAEKTVKSQAELDQLKAAGGDGSLPFITVGSAKMAGFDAGRWDSMLSSAQYPATKMLPANYQFSAATSAAPSAPKAAEPNREAQRRAAEEQAAREQPATREPSATAPPGFRF